VSMRCPVISTVSLTCTGDRLGHSPPDRAYGAYG
jgi:hypothetical protein